MAEKIPIDILVLYGSASDKESYSRILNVLEEEKKKKSTFEYRFFACSAHRTPDILAKILSTFDCKLCLAGAGLAAHLPGVIASKTIKPVIGIPVASNYQGLDAYLSIAQMPPGIPVLSAGLGQETEAAKQAIRWCESSHQIVLEKPESDEGLQLYEKAKNLLEKLNATFSAEDDDENAIHIQFLAQDELSDARPNSIVVPVLLDSTAEQAASIMNAHASGFLVGLKRAENASLAAAELQNMDHSLDNALLLFRKEQHDKIAAGIILE